MKRKVITRCPKSGRTVEVWVDRGTGRANPGGSPLFTDPGQKSPGGRKRP